MPSTSCPSSGDEPFTTFGNPTSPTPVDQRLCNAHHLRDFVHEQRLDWADQMIDCLLDIKLAVDQAAPTADRLPEKQIQAWEARYQQILEEGFAHNPLSPRPANAQKKRGRRKKTKPRNLLERLDQHRQEALAFMYAGWSKGTFA